MAVVTTPAPPPPDAAVGTNPANPTAPPKRKVVEKTKYTVPEGGLKAWPADFKKATNKPLTAKDFAKGSEWIYYEETAKDYAERAKRMSAKAETLKQFGSGEQAQQAGKFLKAAERSKELFSKLQKELNPEQLALLLKSVGFQLTPNADGGDPVIKPADAAPAGDQPQG